MIRSVDFVRVATWLGLLAVLLVAIAQFYTAFFVFRPVAKKAALEEEVAQLSMSSAALEEEESALRAESKKQFDILEKLRATVYSENENLTQKLHIANSLQVNLEEAKTRHAKSELNFGRSKQQLASRTISVNALAKINKKSYEELRPLLLRAVIDRLLTICSDDERAREVVVGKSHVDTYLMVYTDAVTLAITSDAFISLEAVDQRRLSTILRNATKRLSKTRDLIEKHNQVWRAWNSAVAEEWLSRGLPKKADGTPDLERPQTQSRISYDLLLHDVIKAVEERGERSPLKSLPSVDFHLSLRVHVIAVVEKELLGAR